MLARIAMTQLINSVCLAPVVTPWDVYELNDEWLDAFVAYSKRQADK